MNTLFKLVIISLIYVLIPVQSPLFAESMTVEIEGMSCQACADSIAGALQEKEAIEKAGASFDSKSATIELAKGSKLEESELKKIIEDLGYTVSSIKKEE